MTNKKTNKHRVKDKSSVTYREAELSRGLMTGFLTDLEVKESSNGNYKLIDDLVFNDKILGLIAVNVGFVTDFATVPAIGRFIVRNDEFVIRAPSVLHDFLLYSGAVTRAEADGVLYRAMLLRGAPKWKAALVYVAVRIYGGGQ